MGHHSRSMEETSEGDLNCGGPPQEFLDMKKVNKWPGESDIFIKNVSTF